MDKSGETYNESILIVEDEGLIALELEELLKKEGYRIAGIISSGEKALEKTLESLPDLILMDIRLDGPVNGIDAAREIKNNCNIPIIFISALSDDNSLENAKLAEPYSFIVKPFHEKSLLATIKMVLYKSKKIKDLEKRETWFTLMMNELGDAFILCNPQNKVLFINTAAEKLLDIKLNEIQGKVITHFFTLVHNQTKTLVEIPGPDDFQIHSHILLEDILLLVAGGKKIPVDISVTTITLDSFTTSAAGDGNACDESVSAGVSTPTYTSPGRLHPGERIGKILLLRDIEGRKIKQAKMQKEIDTAIVMQQKLLPSQNKPINGISAEWFLHPCSLGAGDLFHIIRINEEHIGFYILDVMGHGISATITSLMLHRILTPDPDKGGILKDTSENPKPPVEVLSELNRHFYGQQPFQFFTIIYGIINTTNGITQCVRAGHNYPVLQDADGDISEILCEGAAIGLYPELNLTQKAFIFEKHNRLFFFSDGLIECANKKNKQFSVQRLYSYLIEAKRKPIKQLTKNLENLLFQWRGMNNFEDDISFMVLERR